MPLLTILDNSNFLDALESKGFVGDTLNSDQLDETESTGTEWLNYFNIREWNRT